MPQLFATNELRRFGRARMPRLALVALLVIPLLYGALYLWAFWNPTENLNQVPVALVNQDRGAVAEGGDSKTEIHAGDDLTTELVKKDNLKWDVTDPVNAQQGLEQGRYVAVLTIPENFSEGAASVATDHAAPTPLKVTYDDTQGYTTRTILSSVMREVRASASAAVGKEVADQLFVSMNDIHSGLVDAADGSGELADGTATARTGSADLANGTAQLHDATGQARDGASQLAAGATKAHQGAGQLASGANQLQAGTGQLASGSQQLHQGADTLSTNLHTAASGSSQLHQGLNTLATSTQELPSQTQQLADGSAQVAAGNREIASKVNTATSAVNEESAKVEQLIQQLPDEDPNKARLVDALARLNTKVDTVNTQVNDLSYGADRVAAGNAKLAGSAPQLAGGIATAASKSGELSSGVAQLDSGATTLATKSGELADGAAKADQGARKLSAGATELDAGTGELATGATKLSEGSVQLDEAMGKADTGAHDLADGIVKLDDGAHELHDKLAEAASKVPSFNDSEREANADTVGDPVRLDTAYQHQANSQGEGFAPYFVGIALYVGAMVMWMLLRPINNRNLNSAAPAWKVVLQSWRPGILIGMAQSVTLLSVLVVGLGLSPLNVGATFGFGLLVSVAFVSLLQAINVWFGSSVGRLLTLVLLTFQLTSAGGTYPVSTSPEFFKVLNQLLPLTQVVNGFREAITGTINQQFWSAVIWLAALAVGSLLVAVLGARTKRMWSMSRLHPEIAL